MRFLAIETCSSLPCLSQWIDNTLVIVKICTKLSASKTAFLCIETVIRLKVNYIITNHAGYYTHQQQLITQCALLAQKENNNNDNEYVVRVALLASCPVMSTAKKGFAPCNILVPLDSVPADSGSMPDVEDDQISVLSVDSGDVVFTGNDDRVEYHAGGSLGESVSQSEEQAHQQVSLAWWFLCLDCLISSSHHL